MSKSRNNDDLVKALVEFDQQAKQIFLVKNPGKLYDPDKSYPNKDFTKTLNFLSGKSIMVISDFAELDQGTKDAHFSGVRDFIAQSEIRFKELSKDSVSSASNQTTEAAVQSEHKGFTPKS